MGVRYPTSGAVSAATSLLFRIEVPTGTVDGAVSGVVTTGNTTFTLSYAPRSTQINNLAIFLNGLLQTPNVDYTISGVTVTFASAPLVGDKLLAVYVALV